MTLMDDSGLRLAARDYVIRRANANGGTVSWQELVDFPYEGERLPLVGQAGIRKPRGLEAALTIRTTYSSNAASRPYYDEAGADGYQRYKWRGEDPNLADNRSLRVAMRDKRPLIWFFGIERGRYVPVTDVYLLAEEPEQHQFVLSFTDLMREQWELASSILMTVEDLAVRREYVVRETKQRLHQPVFRQQVLSAYSSSCAVCRLKHVELLEAAHIREDSLGGEPVVANGVAMCVLHHRAFDNQVIGIRPHDLIVETRASILGEVDGPTLKHAIQGVHGLELNRPRRPEHQPDPLLLEERYERFRLAS